MPNRKTFLQQLALGGAGVFISPSLQALFLPGNDDDYTVPPELQQEMYAAALRIAKSKVRGGPADPAYKKPYADAAFSNNIFLWDTCFIAAYAKYHQQELPIANALDNFYNLQEADGFISREYTKEGKTMWSKEHPVSINPPLLAFAELELHSRQPNRSRLKKVYPHLRRFYQFLLQHYRMDDHLFFNDAFGSGMDNIERFPPGWKDDGEGIQLVNLYPEIFDYNGLSPARRGQDDAGAAALACHNVGPHPDAGTAPIGRAGGRRTDGRDIGRGGGPDGRLSHQGRGESVGDHPDRSGNRRHPDPDDPDRPRAFGRGAGDL